MNLLIFFSTLNFSLDPDDNRDGKGTLFRTFSFRRKSGGKTGPKDWRPGFAEPASKAVRKSGLFRSGDGAPENYLTDGAVEGKMEFTRRLFIFIIGREGVVTVPLLRSARMPVPIMEERG